MIFQLIEELKIINMVLFSTMVIFNKRHFIIQIYLKNQIL